jgi:peptidoglycan/LPS O-acetylase OafA/YrhL
MSAGESTNQKQTNRIYSLDGMRGLGAILVVAYHFGLEGNQNVHSGFLAVDFFFALSGFVIARAYGNQLQRGQSFREFIILRLCRLYPVFGLGLMAGLGKQLVGYLMNSPKTLPLDAMLTSVGLNAFLIPSPFTSDTLFPLNGPSWSLFFEIIINVVFGITLFKARRRYLILISIMGAVLMIVSSYGYPTLDLGWGWSTFSVGVGRVTFSFCVGLIIATFPIRAVHKHRWAALLAPLLLFMMLTYAPSKYQLEYGIIAALIGSPTILVLGIRYEVSRKLNSVCAFLGDISYPLYLTHWPLMFLGVVIARKLHLSETLSLLIYISICIALAAAVEHFFDAPVRRWLKRKTKTPMSAAPVVL